MPRTPNETRTRLIEAAHAEFNGVGFENTHTNAIARRAGFAPQTFYRHFTDKRAVFIAVYENWTRGEIEVIRRSRTTEDLIRSTIEHHRQSKQFRRTLRDLSVRDPAVAESRAASRRSQLEEIGQRWPAFASLSLPERVALVLTFERLSDAIAEGEFEALGVSEGEGIEPLMCVSRRLQPSGWGLSG